MTQYLPDRMEDQLDDRPKEDDMPDRIRGAMVEEGIEHYSMSLVDDDEIEAVIRAVNIGIDAHLTICNSPERGDSYQHGDRSITATSDTDYWKEGDKLQLARTLVVIRSATGWERELRGVFIRFLTSLERSPTVTVIAASWP